MTAHDAGSVRTRLVEIFSATLDLSPDGVTEELSAETAEGWDSIRHLMLVLALEDAFSITFDESQITELMTFSALRKAVEERLGL